MQKLRDSSAPQLLDLWSHATERMQDNEKTPQNLVIMSLIR